MNAESFTGKAEAYSASKVLECWWIDCIYAVIAAIESGKQIKGWTRAKKNGLVESEIPAGFVG
jgi:predicted GIY-YIG superfamily endonuclease